MSRVGKKVNHMTDTSETELTSSKQNKLEQSLDALEPGMKKRVFAAAARSQDLPEFKQTNDGLWETHLPDSVAYMAMFGGGTPRFCSAMVNACANVSGRSDGLKDDRNGALAIVAEIAPKDGIEAMLATQMAAVHIAMMRHSRLMAAAETIPQLDVQEKVFNKLARTFTAQVEALRKHRHGGQQKMTVEHVTVEKGGQAIVGNVTKGGDG